MEIDADYCVTPAEVADACRVCIMTVNRWCREEIIPARQVDWHHPWRIHRDWREAYYARQSETAEKRRERLQARRLADQAARAKRRRERMASKGNGLAVDNGGHHV